MLPSEVQQSGVDSALVLLLATSGSRVTCRFGGGGRRVAAARFESDDGNDANATAALDLERALFSCSVAGQPAGFVGVAVEVDGVQLEAPLQAALRGARVVLRFLIRN